MTPRRAIRPKYVRYVVARAAARVNGRAIDDSDRARRSVAGRVGDPGFVTDGPAIGRAPVGPRRGRNPVAPIAVS